MSDETEKDFWLESYEMLRDAVIEHLGQFIVDDDVAEEAIMIDAIRRAGQHVAATNLLAEVTMPALPTHNED